MQIFSSKSVNALAYGLVFACMMIAPSTGRAQTLQQMLQPKAVDCTAFVRNPDGSWSPTRPVRIESPNGSVQIGPGAAFRPGALMFGMDVGALLERDCR